MSQYTDRFIPAETNGGWGFASGVIALAVLCIVAVAYIHKSTYKHPTDVRWHAKGSSAPVKEGTLGH
jgi:hypothetical protein